MWRTLSGATCSSLLRAPSGNGFFANAKSFFAVCARSAGHGALRIRCRMSGARYKLAGDDCSNGYARMGRSFAKVFGLILFFD